MWCGLLHGVFILRHNLRHLSLGPPGVENYERSLRGYFKEAYYSTTDITVYYNTETKSDGITAQ